MMGEKWVLCPVCGGKTRVKLREDTVLINFPLFCPKCKSENIINAEKLRVKVQKTVQTSV
ncbi:MAG: cysteine-rich KTR domain-containing protein [Oscillospiraceae bacterium]